jgi:hypothetical protein
MLGQGKPTLQPSQETHDLNPLQGFKSSKFTVFYKEGKGIGVGSTNIANDPIILTTALERGLMPRAGSIVSFDEIKAQVVPSSSCSCTLAL